MPYSDYIAWATGGRHGSQPALKDPTGEVSIGRMVSKLILGAAVALGLLAAGILAAENLFEDQNAAGGAERWSDLGAFLLGRTSETAHDKNFAPDGRFRLAATMNRLVKEGAIAHYRAANERGVIIASDNPAEVG